MNNCLKPFIVSIFIFLVVSVRAQDFSVEEIKAFTDYPIYVRQTKFSPYGNYIALTIGNNTVELYDKKYSKVWSWQGNAESVAGFICFSPDEKYMAFSRYKTNGDIGILRLSDLQVIQNLSDHQDYANDLVFTPDGSSLISTSNDYKVLQWNWNGTKFSDPIKLIEYTQPANAAAVSPDGQTMVAVFQDGVVKIFQWKNDRFSEIQTLPGNKYDIECVTFHPSGKFFTYGGSDFNVHIIEKEGSTYKETNLLKGEYGSVSRIAFSPDGKFMAATRNNGTVKIWKMEGRNFKDEKVIARHNRYVFDVSFSNDGKLMSTSSSDPSAIIYSIEGVGPSSVAHIQQFINAPFTSAQRKVLGNSADKILSKIDPALRAPKDEFENKAEYEKRKEKLRAQILLNLQKETEAFFNAVPSKDKSKISVPIQQIGKYDADSEIYTFQFLETPAKLQIPVSEAKALKESWNKARVTSSKSISKDGISYNYNDFHLIHPITGKTYPIEITENPFNQIDLSKTTSDVSPTEGSNDVEDPALFDKNNIPGVNYALLIATNDYNEYPDLTNPVNDAKTISKELTANYNFKVTTIENPSMDSLLSALRAFAQKKYNPKDQLFIFVAGHGKYDEVFKEGYIVVKESKLKDDAKTSLVSHSNLRTIINNIPCEHIFLTMDACFGGTFDPVIASRGTDVYSNITKSEFIDRKLAHKTRLYLTSGGKEYVPDGRPGEHSPFTRKFLEALRSYGGEDGILTTGEVFTYVEKVVPQPRIGEFGNNEPGSDFIFVAK
jgi:hypothetical protein